MNLNTLKRLSKWLLFALIWAVIILVFVGRNPFAIVRAHLPNSFFQPIAPYTSVMPILAVILVVVLLWFRFAQTIGFFLHLLLFPFLIPIWLTIRIFWVSVRISVGIFRFGRFLPRLPILIVNTATSLKLNFIVAVLGTLSVISILNRWYVYFSTFYFVVLLFWIVLLHAQLFIVAFRPGILQRSLVDGFLEYWKSEKTRPETQTSAGEFRIGRVKIGPPRLSATDRLDASKKMGNYLLAYLERLRGNPFPLKVFIAGLVVCFLIVTLLFAAMYYELLAIDRRSFATISAASFLDVYLFSIANMLTTNFGDMLPRSTTARSLATLQLVSSVSIGVILLLVFTTLNKVRFEQELDDAIHDVKQVLQEAETQKPATEDKKTLALPAVPSPPSQPPDHS